MASLSGGSSAARKRAKDGAMAARLKADRVERSIARCPVCNRVVSLSGLYNHIAFHPA